MYCHCSHKFLLDSYIISPLHTVLADQHRGITILVILELEFYLFAICIGLRLYHFACSYKNSIIGFQCKSRFNCERVDLKDLVIFFSSPHSLRIEKMLRS